MWSVVKSSFQKLWCCGNKEHSAGESEREWRMGSCGNMENKINFFPTLMPCPPLLLKQNSLSVSCTGWKANSSPNMVGVNRTCTFLLHKFLLPPAPTITSSPGICSASLHSNCWEIWVHFIPNSSHYHIEFLQQRISRSYSTCQLQHC